MKKLFKAVARVATEVRRRKVDVAIVAYVVPTGGVWALADRVFDTVPDNWNDTIIWIWCTGLVLWAWFTWLFHWNGTRFVVRDPLPGERTFWRWTGRLALPLSFVLLLGAWLLWPDPTLAVTLEAATPEAELYRSKATERIQRALEHERHLQVVLLPAQKPSKGERDVSVDAQLIGKVIKQQETLFVSVQLLKIRGPQRYLAWTSASYTIPTDSVIQFEQRFDSIAALVADSIRPRFLPRFRRFRMPTLLTTHARASAEYSAGRLLLERESPEHLDSARAHFEKAIKADPNMGAAYAGVADIFLVLRERGIFTSTATCDSASQYITAAEARAPRSAEVRTSRGVYHLRCTWQLEKARKHLHRATQAAPDYQRARRWYGLVLALDGRFRYARAELAEAKRIAPFSYGARLSYARALMLEGDYTGAIRELEELLDLEMEPGNDSEHIRVEATRALALAHARAGNSEEALEVVSAFLNDVASRSSATLSAMAQVYAVLGNEAEQRRIESRLTECFSPANYPPYSTAYRHVMTGQDSLAFVWLLRGAKARDPAILNVFQDPAFASMRRKEEYKEHLRSSTALQMTADRLLEADSTWYKALPTGPCAIPRRNR